MFDSMILSSFIVECLHVEVPRRRNNWRSSSEMRESSSFGDVIESTSYM